MERLERIVKLMDFVARHGRQGVSLAQIGYALELPKATLYRLVNELCQVELLIHDPKTNRYHLGWQVFAWAAVFLQRSPYVDLLSDVVNRITDRCQLFSFAAVLTGNKVVTVAIATPRAFYPVYVRLGSSVPLRASAVSKVLLAGMDAKQAYELLRGEELDPSVWSPTPYTLSVDDAFEELETIRRQGWAQCRNELEMGNSAIAVPVGAMEKSWVGLAVVAPTEVIEQREREIMEILREEAQRLEGPIAVAQLIEW